MVTQGEFVWPSHLVIQPRDRDVELGAGDIFVVRRGIEHCPEAADEVYMLLIEPAGTLKTGD